jgi:hypothetical protein
MRIRISVAAIALLSLAAMSAAYFVPDLIRQLWSVSDVSSVTVAQPQASNPSEEKEDAARKKLAFESLTERLPKKPSKN